MNIKKVIDILKGGAEYYFPAAGVMSVALGVIALFVATPLIITIPIIVAIGITCAVYGAYQANKRINQNELQEIELQEERRNYKQDHKELMELARTLKEITAKSPREEKANEMPSTVVDLAPRLQSYYSRESGSANSATFFVLNGSRKADKRRPIPMIDTAPTKGERMLSA